MPGTTFHVRNTADLVGSMGVAAAGRARVAMVRWLHRACNPASTRGYRPSETPMTPLNATAEQPEAPLFSDGIGARVVAVDASTGDLLQILRVRPKLLSVPSFEFALRERAARLANFRHAYYARV